MDNYNVYVVQSVSHGSLIVADGKAEAARLFDKRFPNDDIVRVVGVLIDIQHKQVSDLFPLGGTPDKNYLELLINDELVNVREYKGLPDESENIL